MDETRAPWQRSWLLPGALLADGDGAGPRTPRDWCVDTVLFVWSAAVWAVLAAGLPERENLPHWLLVADPVLGALACAAVWWRRRHPLALAVALIPVGAVSVTVFGALTVTILGLGLRVPRRTAWGVLAAHVALSLPYVFVFKDPGSHTSPWAAAAFLVTYYLFFYAWGAALRARRQLVVRYRDDARRERAEHARRLADARHAEREAIAREMHDVLAHRISLLSVHAGALAHRTGPRTDGHTAPPLTDAEIHDSAELIRDTAHQALEELREVLTVLRGHASGGPAGGRAGMAGLEDLVTDAVRAGQRVTLTRSHGATDASSPRGSVQRTAYRVVQEGLTNARKHAPGAPVTVTVTGGPGQGLTVTVRNPLAGFPADATPIPGAGAGLTGLEERAALDGGTLTHGPAGGAFELVAALPWTTSAPVTDRRTVTGAPERTGGATGQPQLPPH
ncbi:histidine kinase [Streptomyces sp. RFCAC02]|uniref:histidine kinase n=1 Tax=Streptomyces sp. RFCAC02 TaxID=2499143 RepID=UPI0010200B2C|nr:histidine kinase [Streptomyces sp. RFCAC02]